MPYKDKEKHRTAQREWYLRRMSAKKAIVLLAKETGCVQCGEMDPVCLSFHHLQPTQKSFCLGNAQPRRLERIQEEIEKCVILCENCHRKLHAGRFSL